MEGLGGGYSYGQSDLDFPPSDGQLSSAVSSIPSLPPLHLGYPHIQHGGAPHRESAFTAHGRIPPGGDMYALPRFPVVPDVGIRTGGPNFNHLLSRQLSHSPPLPLPHISSFSDPSASYISHSSDRASSSISHSAENLSDHPSFGSIMASAASNISTMNIPHPYNMNMSSQSSGLQNRADLNTSYSGGSADSSEFLNNFNPLPVSAASEVLSQSPEPQQSSFPSAHSSPPTSQAIFIGSRVHSASSSARSIQSDHLTNTAVCQSRVLHNVPMENLDGDQQVPNAVMSPSSSCSSPSLRNTSTPDNRHIGNLLRQAVNNDSIANQTIQNDNMANLRNEQSFANATLIGSELCSSKFIPSVQNVNKNTPQLNFNTNLPTTENCNSEDRNNNMRSFQKEKQRSTESVNENHNEAGLSRHNDNFTMNHSRSATAVSVNTENRTNPVSNVVRKVSPKVKKKLNLEATGKSNSNSHRFHCPNVVSKKTSLQNGKNNVTFLKIGNLADQRSRSSMEISSNLLSFMAQFSNKLLSKENLPACLEYEVDFARMEQEVLSKLMNMRNGLSSSFLPYQTQDDEDGITNYCDSVNNGNGCYDNYNNGEDEQTSKRRKSRRPSYIQQSNEESDIDEQEEDIGRFPVKSESDLQETFIDFPSDELSPDAKRVTNRFRPFAITSPSFARSAAPAVMTTTVSDNATMVTISIKGKGSSHKTKTKTININQGGLMSVGPIGKSQQGGEDEEEDAESEEEDGEEGSYSLGVQKTSIMSKLHREKEETKDGGSCDGEDLVEKMEVNIRIDDSQLVQHGEQKRWQCHVCTKSYTTKHNLVTHILDHNGIKPHLCMMCGKYFKQLSHLNTHMLTHDNIRPHKCNLCGKGFTQISHLKRHQAVHLDSKPYICDICNRGFAYPSELKSHKEKHAQGTKDKCEECDVEFDSPRALKLHLLKHENRQDLICKYCDKAFRYPSQLKDHLVSHEGSRPYICTECGMDFMKEHHLKAHQFTHTGQRPYNCPKCGRAFNQRANMMRHMLIHNPTRAFQCDICGKKFTQPQTLKAHKVVHAETKPHKCKVCGKQFGRLHNLQGHMHMHNNTKPYICFCGSSFTLKGNLNRHKKVKHGLNESTESLEEQAVSFLSSLSGRSLHEIDDTDDNDYDQELTASSSESRSHRKGRKSIPRKIMRRHRSTSGKLENFEASDEEDADEDEDEEDSHGSRNDANVSRYFRALNEVEPEKCTRDAYPVESYHRSERQIKAKKSLRKRRAPKRISMMEDMYDEYSEDSEGQGQSAGKENEDISDSESLLKRARLGGGKGEKLDSIIAEKFKNV